jgi:hypothetical protein
MNHRALKIVTSVLITAALITMALVANNPVLTKLHSSLAFITGTLASCLCIGQQTSKESK